MASKSNRARARIVAPKHPQFNTDEEDTVLENMFTPGDVNHKMAAADSADQVRINIRPPLPLPSSPPVDYDPESDVEIIHRLHAEHADLESDKSDTELTPPPSPKEHASLSKELEMRLEDRSKLLQCYVDNYIKYLLQDISTAADKALVAVEVKYNQLAAKYHYPISQLDKEIDLRIRQGELEADFKSPTAPNLPPLKYSKLGRYSTFDDVDALWIHIQEAEDAFQAMLQSEDESSASDGDDNHTKDSVSQDTFPLLDAIDALTSTTSHTLSSSLKAEPSTIKIKLPSGAEVLIPRLLKLEDTKSWCYGLKEVHNQLKTHGLTPSLIAQHLNPQPLIGREARQNFEALMLQGKSSLALSGTHIFHLLTTYEKTLRTERPQIIDVVKDLRRILLEGVHAKTNGGIHKWTPIMVYSNTIHTMFHYVSKTWTAVYRALSNYDMLDSIDAMLYNRLFISTLEPYALRKYFVKEVARHIKDDIRCPDFGQIMIKITWANPTSVCMACFQVAKHIDNISVTTPEYINTLGLDEVTRMYWMTASHDLKELVKPLDLVQTPTSTKPKRSGDNPHYAPDPKRQRSGQRNNGAPSRDGQHKPVATGANTTPLGGTTPAANMPPPTATTSASAGAGKPVYPCRKCGLGEHKIKDCPDKSCWPGCNQSIDDHNVYKCTYNPTNLAKQARVSTGRSQPPSSSSSRGRGGSKHTTSTRRTSGSNEPYRSYTYGSSYTAK